MCDLYIFFYWIFLNENIFISPLLFLGSSLPMPWILFLRHKLNVILLQFPQHLNQEEKQLRMNMIQFVLKISLLSTPQITFVLATYKWHLNIIFLVPKRKNTWKEISKGYNLYVKKTKLFYNFVYGISAIPL
jgi:hypothetical protein